MAVVVTPHRRENDTPFHPLWKYYSYCKAVSLIREDGVWSEVEWADQDRIAAADVFLQGGLHHEVSEEYGQELDDLGYEVI